MSGGHFEGSYHISDIAEQIESIIAKNKEVDEYGYCNNYSNNTIAIFKYISGLLKVVSIAVHRIDYLVSGYDGEPEFHKRLDDDLKGLT